MYIRAKCCASISNNEFDLGNKNGEGGTIVITMLKNKMYVEIVLVNANN